MLMATPHTSENWRKSVAGIVEVGKKLLTARNDMPREKFLLYALRETGLDESSTHKLIALAHHPVIADPKNASKLPAGWVKLYNLSRLPCDTLLEFIADGRAIALKKTEMRKVLYGSGMDHRGQAIRLVNGAPIWSGEESVSDVVRKGLKLERSGVLPRDAANTIGLSLGTYMKLRKLILLTERDDLSPEDKKIVDGAARSVNIHRRLSNFLTPIDAIAEKVWGANHVIRLGGPRHNKATANRRKESFHTAIVVIADTCAGSTSIEIPPLSSEERAAAMRYLQSAKKSIAELSRKIWRAGQ